MFKTLILLLATASMLAGQERFSTQAIAGEWEMIGVSAQNKEIPEFKGLVNVYLYTNEDFVLKTAAEGINTLHKGHWYKDSLDDEIIHLETGTEHFQWKIKALDHQTLVVEELKDEANITFRKKNTNSDKLSSKKLEGQWFLVEAAGKTYNMSAEAPAHVLLNENQKIQVSGFSNFEAGQWALSPDAKFFIVSDSLQNQIFELLYTNTNTLVLRDGEVVFFFRRKAEPGENQTNIEKRLPGTWAAENPQLPVLNALLLFQKDGTMNGISNLNSELKKWKLSDNGKTLTLMPFLDSSKEKVFQLRLYMIDKNVMLLSDEEWTVVFKKK